MSNKNMVSTCGKCENVWLGNPDTKKPRCPNKECRSIEVKKVGETGRDEAMAIAKLFNTLPNTPANRKKLWAGYTAHAQEPQEPEHVIHLNEDDPNPQETLEKAKQEALAGFTKDTPEELTEEEKGKLESPIPPKDYEKIDIREKTEKEIRDAQARIDAAIDSNVNKFKQQIESAFARLREWLRSLAK